MAKPLRSEENIPPKSMQFAHFGVLNDGQQSKSSLFTSVTLNVLLAIIVIVIGAAARKTIDRSKKLTMLTEPVPIKPIEPIKPKPKPLPPPPVVKVTPPKIPPPPTPEVKLPEPPKPVEVVKVTPPTPVVKQPAPPKAVEAPPAPKVVNLGRPAPAAVVNNSPHPSAVSLGQANNPIAPSDRPATATVNLGQRGLAGMPASNTGSGPQAKSVNLGSGSPGGQNLAAKGGSTIQGVKLGVAGGTGPATSTGRVAGPVNLGQNQPPPTPRAATPTSVTTRSGPKVLFKPRPQYTAEAIQLHLEGVVSVRLRVSSAGAVQVLGVTSGLGHGLDEAAVHAVQTTRFAPAIDSNGNPTDWDGVVNVAFQLAG